MFYRPDDPIYPPLAFSLISTWPGSAVNREQNNSSLLNPGELLACVVQIKMDALPQRRRC